MAAPPPPPPAPGPCGRGWVGITPSLLSSEPRGWGRGSGADAQLHSPLDQTQLCGAYKEKSVSGSPHGVGEEDHKDINAQKTGRQPLIGVYHGGEKIQKSAREKLLGDTVT